MTSSVDEAEGSSIVGIDPTSRSVVLTYDDGPTAGVTDQLLSVLADAGATATFFVLLTRARRHRDLLRQLVATGHDVGLHGPDHTRLTTLPHDVLPGRMRDARSELEDLVERPVRWFRPPYGAQDATTWRAVREAGMTPVLWTVDCADWLTLPRDDYLHGLRARPLDGSIVLLHDGFADAADGVDDGSPPELDRVALTRAVLTEVRAAGLVATCLSTALGGADPVVRPWFDEG